MVCKKSVLLATKNNDETKKFIDVLRLNEMQVHLCQKNGIELLEMMYEINPDVIIMEAFMSYIDGLGVLSRINNMNPVDRPLIIVMTSIDDDSLQKEFFKNGADYCFVKPFESQMVAERIIQMLSWKSVGVFANSQATQEMELAIGKILHQIGFSAKLKGYTYLREAIMMVIDNPSIINRVTTVLYPTIAQNHKCDAASVERAMRYAIKEAWDKGNISTFKTYFGYAIKNPKRPTNSEFIALIADDLRFKRKMHMTLDGPYNCVNLF